MQGRGGRAQEAGRKPARRGPGAPRLRSQRGTALSCSSAAAPRLSHMNQHPPLHAAPLASMAVGQPRGDAFHPVQAAKARLPGGAGVEALHFKAYDRLAHLRPAGAGPGGAAARHFGGGSGEAGCSWGGESVTGPAAGRSGGGAPLPPHQPVQQAKPLTSASPRKAASNSSRISPLYLHPARFGEARHSMLSGRGNHSVHASRRCLAPHSSAGAPWRALRERGEPN